MTKAEIRAQVKDTVIEQIVNAIEGLVKIDDYTYAIRVGTAEDNGAPLYAKIEVSAPNWYATKTAQAFDIDVATEKYEAKIAERDRKEVERAAKKAEKA